MSHEIISLEVPNYKISPKHHGDVYNIKEHVYKSINASSNDTRHPLEIYIKYIRHENSINIALYSECTVKPVHQKMTLVNNARFSL